MSCRVKELTIKRHIDVKEVIKVLTSLIHKIILNKLFLRSISSDLKWNTHIVDCIKKANKRLYFIVLLKRARVPLNDIVNFYCTTIRPVLEYCTPVFHHTFAAFLTEDIERIQKRALSIISPATSYWECLDSLGLPTLYDRCNGLCRQLFDSITINPRHKL